ncbi:MAG TPA: hypothetical protein VGB82_22960 [Alphaproteobacteria bacterium]
MLTPMRLCALTLAAGAALATITRADEIPAGWQASNMKPVGFNNLEGRATFKLAVKQVQGRWYLYTTTGGINVLDVTDPADPKLIKWIPGPKGTSMSQVTLHDNLMLTALARPITPEEGSGKADDWITVQKETPADKPFEEGVQLWDISTPGDPKLVGKWESHAAGTHRNVYAGGNHAWLSATVPGFRGFILVVLDVSNPAQPKEAGRWWYPGQKADENPGEVTPSFHGPVHVSPDGKMISTGYTPAVINLDISDPAHPKLIGQLVMIPPFVNTGTQSIHTVVPLWDKKLLYVNSESSKSNCEEPLNFAGLIDNSNPARPSLLSLFPVPVPPPGAPYKDFCEKGGRFGPHNVNTEIHLPDVEKPGDLIYLTYFAAGLRVFNIANPRLPTEVGWFIPPNPKEPRRAQGGMVTVNQTQDVLVDTRGVIYISDSAGGVWTLRYTGEGQPKPTAR